LDQLVEIIAGEIEAAGAISFARFMELALYCPIYGYYEAEKDTVGRRGDYFTSVSVGPLFGGFLAFQFTQWLTNPLIGKPGPLRIVEAGAHSGDLARDILTWVREQRPELWDRLHYHILEPSSRRQEWQRAQLAGFGNQVIWNENFSALGRDPQGGPESGFGGVIFSNEFLDALPVHRLGWDAKMARWFEWGVTMNGTDFGWARTALAPDLSLRPLGWAFESELLALLPDGFTLEVSPAAEQWWRDAASLLTWGKLVTLDYGLSGDELLKPERSGGTLRAYRRQRICADVLANPGHQDITAHVNFSAIRAAGESVGLETRQFISQGRFLTEIATQTWKEGAAFGEWSARRTRQFQTLTHPEHLGARFQVLVQGRRALPALTS
jgi:SAM-dependent MidA family methyltransferase